MKLTRDRLIVCELAANGYGNPEGLMKTRVDLVLDAYEYMTFSLKYKEQVRLALRGDDE